MTCTYWCSEVSASFFHTAFTNSHGKKGGVAFGEKGHEVHDKRRISIGLRWTFLLSWSHGKHQGRPKYNMHLFQMFSGRLINKSLLVGNSNFLLFLLSLTPSYSSSLVIIIVLRDSSLLFFFDIAYFWSIKERPSPHFITLILNSACDQHVISRFNTKVWTLKQVFSYS